MTISIQITLTIFTYFRRSFLIKPSKFSERKLLRKERKALRICLAIPQNTPNRIIYNLAKIEPLDSYINETYRKYYTRASNKAFVQDLIDDAPPNTTAFLMKNLAE